MATVEELYPGVVTDPHIVHGQVTLKRTRVPVALVLGQLASGVTYEEMRAEYHLTPEQIQTALAYAARLVASTKLP